MTETSSSPAAAVRAAVWLDAADVARWLGLTATGSGLPNPDDEQLLAAVVAQTMTHVQKVRSDCWTVVDAGQPTEARVFVPDPECHQGAVMFAARAFRRRNSPTGVQNFGDAGVSFVSRWDADIDRALRTGAFTPPAVG